MVVLQTLPNPQTLPNQRLLVAPTLTALLLSTLLLTPACSAPGTTMTVLSVGDGDTIRVRGGDGTLTVRLACIDAPEMAQRPHGENARLALRKRLPIGQSVTLNIKTIDRYGRTVAEVFKDQNINLALVEEGQAFAYRRYLNRCDRQAYLEAEDRASRRRRGIWQPAGGITPPWTFRSKLKDT